jgi:hypothetical protein
LGIPTVHFLAEFARLGLGAYQVCRFFFAILGRPSQFGQIDIEALLEIRIGEDRENLGTTEFPVSLADRAAEEMINFSHIVSLGGMLYYRGCRWIGCLGLITALSPGNNSDHPHQQV